MYKAWFALALLFLVLGISYQAVWYWAAVPPTPASDLREMSGTLETVENVSRSANSIQPTLDVHIAGPGGRKDVLHIRNRNVTFAQFRSYVGNDVRVRYSGETGVVYEFFSAGRQIIEYDASYKHEFEIYHTLIGASRLVFAISAVSGLIGVFAYFWTRLKTARRAVNQRHDTAGTERDT